jgi:hypothetical protein
VQLVFDEGRSIEGTGDSEGVPKRAGGARGCLRRPEVEDEGEGATSGLSEILTISQDRSEVGGQRTRKKIGGKRMRLGPALPPMKQN